MGPQQWAENLRKYNYISCFTEQGDREHILNRKQRKETIKKYKQFYGEFDFLEHFPWTKTLISC